MQKKILVCLILIFLLTGCNPFTISTPTLTPTNTSTPFPSPTFAPISTATATPTSVPLVLGVCSPLQGIELSDLWRITSNTYRFKYPFSEGPSEDKNHPAVDLGFYNTKVLKNYLGEELTTDDGFPIQALLPGKVVEVLDDRYPYGNMVLIETPLTAISPDLLAKIQIPQPYSGEEIKAHSPCAQDQTPISLSKNSKSIYTLYAHMQNPSALKAGDEVQCGELIGAIGATGNSAVSIEHLHLEIRVGPSDAKFGVISAYISSSTEEERYNYCIWALSEVFQPIDPSSLWSSSSKSSQ